MVGFMCLCFRFSSSNASPAKYSSLLLLSFNSVSQLLTPRLQVTKTVWGAFPLLQNRICVSLDNNV